MLMGRCSLESRLPAAVAPSHVAVESGLPPSLQAQLTAWSCSARNWRQGLVDADLLDVVMQLNLQASALDRRRLTGYEALVEFCLRQLHRCRYDCQGGAVCEEGEPPLLHWEVPAPSQSWGAGNVAAMPRCQCASRSVGPRPLHVGR